MLFNINVNYNLQQNAGDMRAQVLHVTRVNARCNIQNINFFIEIIKVKILVYDVMTFHL